MSKISIKRVCLVALLTPLSCGTVLAQKISATDTSEVTTHYVAVGAAAAPDIVFSNLDPRPDNHFNSDPSSAFPITGVSAVTGTEVWDAIAFTPKVDTRAQVLSVAIGYISGTKIVNLGIYTEDVLGTVGTLVPGSLVNLTQVPDAGSCCELATVTLSGQGVLLTGGTRYWLAATADDVNAPTFSGAWRVSNRAESAQLIPPFPWGNSAGQWPAAVIRGTNVQSSRTDEPIGRETSPSNSNARGKNVILYTTLGPGPTGRYSNSGPTVAGDNVPSQPADSVALPFTLRANAHAKTLAATIGYVFGTKKVNLGIYSDNEGNVGTPLAGGQGSTTDIPNYGTCCDLTEVSLPGPGVALTKGTQYWLVAMPDDENAGDFLGIWQTSNLSSTSYREPEEFIAWTSFDCDLLGAEIRGTNP